MFLYNSVSDDREKKAYQAKTLLEQVHIYWSHLNLPLRWQFAIMPNTFYCSLFTLLRPRRRPCSALSSCPTGEDLRGAAAFTDRRIGSEDGEDSSVRGSEGVPTGTNCAVLRPVLGSISLGSVLKSVFDPPLSIKTPTTDPSIFTLAYERRLIETKTETEIVLINALICVNLLLTPISIPIPMPTLTF
jgi:hypothetical protein